MKVTNLTSGSKGNCTFVESNIKILVDVGISYRNLNSNLKLLESSAENIDAVLITHEHSDHVFGLEILLKKCPHIKVWANSWVWQKITKRYLALANFDNVHFFEYNMPFSVGDFTVTALENFHDSVSCASFIISSGGGKLGICTDLGIITDYQIEMLKTCKVVYLECNHDLEMLASCGYPRILQSRISGDCGHLSNDQCARACVRLASHSTKVVVLSHISQNSNLPEVAYSRVMDELTIANKTHLMVLLSYQNKLGKTITIN